MKLELYTKKIQNWYKKIPVATNKAIKHMLQNVKREVIEAFSGKIVNVRTGKTRAAITEKFDAKKMNALVYIKKPRVHVAVFAERGTINQRATPVFGPLKNKYTPLLANEILKKLIQEYING